MISQAKKGFSLLEIMMSVVIFGIIALGLITPVSNSLYLSANNKSISTAGSLARTYLKDLQSSWKIQRDYDHGTLKELDNTYTNQGKYTVNVTSEDVSSDDDGNVILRRVHVVYKDLGNHTLCDIFYDYDRPGRT